MWIWDVKSGRPLVSRSAAVSDHQAFSVQYSPDGSVLAVASQTGTVRFWDRVARKRLGALACDALSPKLAFSVDGRVFGVCGFRDNDVRLWNMRDLLADRADPSAD